MNPLKLLVLGLGISLIAQSCSGPTYAQNTPPPPPVYVQQPAPPPPAASVYVQPEQEAPPPVSYQSFYNTLSPYGQWINTPEYGFVWVPSAGPDFQPYGSEGHWVLTDYGWTWASDYSWGWAPFHYGSWEYDGMMGWYWIPGYQWSPAWVNWRTCNGYYGWAPLGPTYTYGGYATYNCPPERYVFINATYMGRGDVGSYYLPRSQNNTFYSRSSVITNTYYDRGSNNTYYAGPPSSEVERYTGAPVRQVTIAQASSPENEGASGSQLRMYRPSVQQPNNTSRPAPEKVYQKTEVAPVQQRQVLAQPTQGRMAPNNNANSQNRQQQEQNKPQQQNNQQQPAQQQRPPVQEQQHPANQQPQQQQPVQQRQAPPQQQPQQQAPAQQQHPAVQQQPQTQQPPVQQQHPVTQQQPQQQHPVAQQQPQQQHPNGQQPVKQQQQKGGKQQKPSTKSQPKQQQGQGGQQAPPKQ